LPAEACGLMGEAEPGETTMSRSRRFATYAWFVLAYTVLAAVWGAFVRATGSGAGCGNHWPLCNGEVVPRAPAVATVIEFTHRVTSGLIGLWVLALVLWAIRRFGRYHRVPRAAFAALVLTVVEALIGACLVRFDLVAGNASVLRGSVMAAHLVNTFLLLASLALTAAWASGVETPRLRGQGVAGWLLALGLGALCVLGASGAVTALGDTLFPVASLTDDVVRGLSPAGRLLVRLRIFHPFLAVGVGAYLAAMAAAVRVLRPVGGSLRTSARRRPSQREPGRAGLATARPPRPRLRGLDRHGAVRRLRRRRPGPGSSPRPPRLGGRSLRQIGAAAQRGIDTRPWTPS